MPLSKRWRPMGRESVGAAPDRYGVVEFGDDGAVETVKTGIVRDVLKQALAYESHEQVRWQAAQNREHAERLAEEHRDRV